MSWQDSDKVRGIKVGNSAAKFVLRCLADFKNSETGQCYPSVQTISQETELNTKTVFKALKYLEEHGFIRKERVVKNASNRYLLFLDHSISGYSENGTTNYGCTKYGCTKNGMSVDPNIGVVDIPKTVHETLIEKVNNRVLITSPEQNSADLLRNPDEPIEEKTDGNPITEPQPKFKYLASHCPIEKILEMYHKDLPAMPKIRSMTSSGRTKQLKTFWKNLVLDQEYESEEEALAWFERYFKFCAKSDFLNGRTTKREGHTNWRADLFWLLKLENYDKVVDRRYHNNG